MALTPAQRAFNTRFLGVPLRDLVIAGGQGLRTPGQAVSPAVDALIVGGLVFSDLDETIVASGPFFTLGQSLLNDPPARLRAGEPVHHEPF